MEAILGLGAAAFILVVAKVVDLFVGDVSCEVLTPAPRGEVIDDD